MISMINQDQILVYLGNPGNLCSIKHIFMKIFCDGTYKHNPEYILRRCGYGKMVGRNTGQTSYMRMINGRNLYPRFHAYLEDYEGGFQINLHLDQRQPSYTGTSAHGGEYEGEVVEREGARIRALINTFKI